MSNLNDITALHFILPSEKIPKYKKKNAKLTASFRKTAIALVIKTLFMCSDSEIRLKQNC